MASFIETFPGTSLNSTYWTIINASYNVNVSGGLLTLTGGWWSGDNPNVAPTSSVPKVQKGYYVEYYMKLGGSASSSTQVGLYVGSYYYFFGYIWNVGGGATLFASARGNQTTIAGSYESSFHTYKIWYRSNGDIEFYFDGTLVKTYSGETAIDLTLINLQNYDGDRNMIFDTITVTYYAPSPTLTTNSATDITNKSATLNGNLTNLNGCTVSEEGFVWGTTSKSDPGNVAPGSSGYDFDYINSGSFSTGAFFHSIASLSRGIRYYFRSYINSSSGYIYGSELYFDTLPEPDALRTFKITHAPC